MLNYHDLLQLGVSADIPTLTKRMVDLASCMGYGLTSAVLVRGRLGSENAMLQAFGNPPDGYMETVDSLPEGLRDPLLARLLARPGHVTYDQQLYTEAGAGDLWDAQAPFGFQSGVAVSIHEPSHAEAFMLGLDGLGKAPAGPTLLLLQANLQMLAMHAQSAIARIVAARSGVQQVELDRHEQAAIKTAGARIFAQRGHLVGMSEIRTDPAMRSAARKLGARSITDVVLRSIDGGLLHP